MSEFTDSLKRLFSRNVIVKRLPGDRLKTFDVNKTQMANNASSTSTYRMRWRTGRNFSNSSGYGSGYTNYEIEALRKQMYIDYELMDTDSIISSALDILADEVTSNSVDGQLLVIKTDDDNIKKILHNLFYDVLNIEQNLWSHVRTACKYGDDFWYLEIQEGVGVINAISIHPSLMIREEGSDEDPNMVKFKYEGDGGFYVSSQLNTFDNYQIAHFRLLGDSNFLPYGSSHIEKIRKDYHRLVLAEDAMILHRITRAPERRIFKIDVGNINPNEIDAYIQQLVSDTKRTPFIDPNTGQYNKYFNVNNAQEDLYLPVRGDKSGTTVETLPGLTNEGQLDDIEYLKSKMMAGLKIPKAYLGYDESTAKCLHPNTEISLLDGTVKTIKEISDLFEQNINQNLWAYTFDFSTNSVIPTKILIAKQTRKNASICRVHLDNGTYVDCTPDHKFILNGGDEVEAQYLNNGDSLQVINRRFHNMYKKLDYEQVFQPSLNKWVWTHTMVDEYVNGKIENNGWVDGKFDRQNIIVRHHIDFNRFNNNPTNLYRCTQYEHCIIHSENMNVGIHSASSKAKSKKYLTSDIYKSHMSELQKNRIKNSPELGLKLRDNWLSYTKEERSKIIKSGRDIDFGKTVIANNKKYNKAEKMRSKLAELYPNGRTDLQGSNSVRYIKRPDFNNLLDFIKSYPNKFEINSPNLLSDKFGYSYVAIRDVIEQNGYNTFEFFNEYIGLKEGRKYDLRLSYLTDIFNTSNTIESALEKLKINDKTLYRNLNRHNVNVEEFISNELGKLWNHKVVLIEFLTEQVDTYNMEVDNENHNYLLSNGIVIKNSNLASEDIRFAKLIERIQKLFTSELYKIAITHLYVQGYRDEDLLSFELELTSPSLIYQRQKIDLLNEQFNLITNILETKLVSDIWIYENVLGWTKSEWEQEKLRVPNFLKDIFRNKQIEEEGNDPKVTRRTFGTPHDIASMQVASKFDATNLGSLEKLYSKDEREDNEGQPFKYKSFETVKDEDFGRDPTGRRDVDKGIKGNSQESFIRSLNKRKQTGKSLLKESTDPDLPNMLNENNILED